MKKVYIQPTMQSLAVQTEGVIAVSVGFGKGAVSANEALTKKKEDGIWNEGEESKDGIW